MLKSYLTSFYQLGKSVVVGMSAENKSPQSSGNGESSQESNPLAEFLASLRERLPTSDLDETPLPVLEEATLESVVEYIKMGKSTNVIVMTGAGISTAAGIPDFRSPGTGLYDNMEKYNLPNPMAVFEIGYFMENPQPFFELARELFPKDVKPTTAHYFIRLLHEKKMLLRVYTQNIDTLEHIAGVPHEKIIEAHGSYHQSTCTQCRRKYTAEWLKGKIYTVNVPRCDEESCDGVVKPDIVFFGERLPEKFFTSATEDFPDCDLLLIMGTSLVVQPFCGLIDRVNRDVPRLLINKDKAGQVSPIERMLGLSAGLDYDNPANRRDVFWQGTCDDGVLELARQLGWQEDLHKLIDGENSGEKKETKNASSSSAAESAIGATQKL